MRFRAVVFDWDGTLVLPATLKLGMPDQSLNSSTVVLVVALSTVPNNTYFDNS